MFVLLVALTGAGIAPIPNLTDSWKYDPNWQDKYKKPDPYTAVMMQNAQEGVRFRKPLEGHEDGCIMGVCKERGTSLANDGVLHDPMHTPVSRLSRA
jgi:hypothetical protein